MRNRETGKRGGVSIGRKMWLDPNKKKHDNKCKEQKHVE
jgi:hypothetical protein